jgi:hypothetical protein
MIRRTTILASILALSVSLTTGCIGGMALSGKVTEFNLDVHPNRWVREAVFLALYFIPVYPFAGMADLLVVNSIEFHTGTNPVSGKARIARIGETRSVTAPDGSTSVSTLREDGSIDLEVTTADGTRHFVNLAEGEGRVVARDETGAELASAPY